MSRLTYVKSDICQRSCARDGARREGVARKSTGIGLDRRTTKGAVQTEEGKDNGATWPVSVGVPVAVVAAG